jgi:hypothetical protein
MEFKLNELDVQKINLKEGDTLMITIKHEEVDFADLQDLQKQFKNTFPNNKVFLFAMGSVGEVKFAVATTPEVMYCSNCNCGKKEIASKE